MSSGKGREFGQGVIQETERRATDGLARVSDRSERTVQKGSQLRLGQGTHLGGGNLAILEQH